MDRVTMTIDGMSCGHCVGAVKGALATLEGVQVEQVTVGKATVSFDPAAISAERIAQAVTDEGYPVVAAER